LLHNKGKISRLRLDMTSAEFTAVISFVPWWS